jgi:hypothetical protein
VKYITVGSQKPESQCDSKKKSPQYWKYGDVPLQKKEWVVDLKYRPSPFDMCCLKIKESKRIINGWWTGFEWQGLHLAENYSVIAWKINKEFY